eukprot:gene13356-biopygen3615
MEEFYICPCKFTSGFALRFRVRFSFCHFPHAHMGKWSKFPYVVGGSSKGVVGRTKPVYFYEPPQISLAVFPTPPKAWLAETLSLNIVSNVSSNISPSAKLVGLIRSPRYMPNTTVAPVCLILWVTAWPVRSYRPLKARWSHRRLKSLERYRRRQVSWGGIGEEMVQNGFEKIHDTVVNTDDEYKNMETIGFRTEPLPLGPHVLKRVPPWAGMAIKIAIFGKCIMDNGPGGLKLQKSH